MSSLHPDVGLAAKSKSRFRSRSDRRGEDARIACAVILLAKASRALHGLKLAEVGFQNGQDELLITLDREGKTVSAVADELDIRPSTVSKMVDRLVEKALISRVEDPKDARRTILRITQRGSAVQETLIQARETFGAEIAAVLPPDLNVASLEEFVANMQVRLRRLR